MKRIFINTALEKFRKNRSVQVVEEVPEVVDEDDVDDFQKHIARFRLAGNAALVAVGNVFLCYIFTAALHQFHFHQVLNGFHRHLGIALKGDVVGDLAYQLHVFSLVRMEHGLADGSYYFLFIEADDAPVTLKIRIEDDLCTISLDTSGESLHKRGHKQAVGKAPMRETMAAMFLRECGFDGREPVLDPMCGSGTFVIEAAEIAAGLAPGRLRGFAFEQLPGFGPQAWAALRTGAATTPALTFYGRDRDPGAIRMSHENAERAGVGGWTDFQACAFADLTRPEGPPGLVMINPPYGARIGNKGPLFGLHAAMGEVLRSRFRGWRVGLVTSEPQLARATGLPFRDPGPYVAHGGLKIRLFQTGPL